MTKYEQEKGYRKIKRNRDNKGNILTYSVYIDGIEYEYNTLKEARLMAKKEVE